MDILFPFLNFLQPGIFWPQLAEYKPMVLLTMLAIVVGLAKKSAFLRREAFAHPVFRWMTAFLLVQVVSLLSTGVMGALGTVPYFGGFLLFVVASILLITDERALARFVWGMMAGGLFLVGFGIRAVIEGWPEAVGGRAGAYGMYENHNDYSFIIIQILPFIFLYRGLAGNFFGRMTLWAALIACVVGMLMSLSRGGMLALVLEFTLIVLIGMRSPKRFYLLPVLALLGAGAIAYQWAQRAENQGSNYTAADAEQSRFELWRAGYRMVLDKPLLGVGAGRFGEYAQQYGEISGDNRGKNSHNTYLEVLTGTGLIGFVCFLMMIRRLIQAVAHRPTGVTTPLLDATRRATLIAILSILFRAILDAKQYDWSFYILSLFGIVYAVLQRRCEAMAASGTVGDGRAG